MSTTDPWSFSRRTFLWTGGSFLALRAAKLRGAVLPQPAIQRPCLVSSQTKYPPMLAKFIAKLDPRLDVFPCEVDCEEIERVLGDWTSALRRGPGKIAAIERHLAQGLLACSLTPSQAEPVRTSGPLRVEKRSFQGQAITGREKFASELAAYMAGWSSLDTVELEIYGIRAAGSAPFGVETDIRYDLVGTAHDGAREQRIGAWHLRWVKAMGAGENRAGEEPLWNVKEWMADAELRSRRTGPGFTEVTGACMAAEPGTEQLAHGIDHWRTALDGASGIDVYGNHGVAIGDIDGSGYDSFYVCQPSGLPNRLFRNRGDGTFDDITEKSQTGILDGTASAVFADFQNMGKQDLLVVRTGGPLLFVNAGDGRFEPKPDAFRFARPPQGTFTSAAVADYNRDGFLDVYLCVYSYYQGLNQYEFPSPYYDAQNGPPNFLFRNRGDGTFEDATVASGMDQNNNRYSFAAAWCDYDGDGWPDLYVANDFGRKNLYRSHGNGTFSDVAAAAGVEDYGPGMSTCWLDHNNDGLQDVYVANMWLPEGKRITADANFLPGVDPAVRALYQKHNAGNSLYRNTGKGGFENETAKSGTAMGRWSWSCGSWDFDHDGWADLYVANGFVSGPNASDLQSFFWRQVAQRSMTSAGSLTEYEQAWNAVNELVRSDYSWSGCQRNVFFANNGDGSFSDVSGALGLDLNDDCRAFALSDFDHDGRLEFVLKNRTGPQVRVFRNDLEDIGNSVAFRLTGRASNRDAIGAVVTIEAGATRQTKFIAAGSGFASQHTKELFFGLGAASNPISISVRWPAGGVARYDNIPVNHRVEIVEGEPAVKALPYNQGASRKAVPAGALPIPPAPATVSTWLVAPLLGPDLDLSDTKGEKHRLSDLRGRRVLLVFLASGCDDSRKQLEELQRSFTRLSSAGLSLFVVALASTTDPGGVDDRMGKGGSNFPVCIADERAVGAWNIQYRYLFDRRRDMTAPMSFLLDEAGAIVRMYQGVAATEDVLHDARSTAATPAELLARAMPFPGQYYGGGMKHDYLTFGIAFAEFGYTDDALTAFQRAIEVNPGQANAWFNLGTIYLGKKMYPEARKYLTEAARLNQQDADAWNNLGMISGEEEKFDEALDEFRHAALVNPGHPLAVENMLRIYRYQGDVASAQKTLKELISRAPENAGLHLALAMTMVAQNDMPGALEELRTSVRLQPGNPDALNNLGGVLLSMGKDDEALSQFEQSLRLNPDFGRACINVALIYNRKGEPDKARQTLTNFLARHPDDAAVRGALEKMGAP